MTHLVIYKSTNINTIRYTTEIDGKTFEMTGEITGDNRFNASKFITDILSAANPNLYISYYHGKDGNNLVLGDRHIKVRFEHSCNDYTNVTDICNLLKGLNRKIRETVSNAEQYTSEEVYI
jgi:hypothetical protein